MFSDKLKNELIASWTQQIANHPQKANDLEVLHRLQQAAEPFLKELKQFSEYYEGVGSYASCDVLGNLKDFLYKVMPDTIESKYEFRMEWYGGQIDASQRIRFKKLDTLVNY